MRGDDKLIAGALGIWVVLVVAWWAFVITVIVLALKHFGIV